MSLTSPLHFTDLYGVIPTLRPAAAPLVAHSPYFSVWSNTDKLTGGVTKHWTGMDQPMAGLIRIDGAPYRFMGPDPKTVPALEQREVTVLPTRTIYKFDGAGIALTVEFLSPLLPDDLDLLTRPVTYVTVTTRSIDGKAHDVEVYFDVAAELAVNMSSQNVTTSRHRVKGYEVISARCVDQQVLHKSGDHLRIDWGTLYLSTASSKAVETAIGGRKQVRGAFAEQGQLPETDDMRFPRAANDQHPVLACSIWMGLVGADETSRHWMISYDEEFSVEYMNRRLPAFWRRKGMQMSELLKKAYVEYPEIRRRCVEFDESTMQELYIAGGHEYAQIAALAYRQCLSAHTIVEDHDGTLLMFSKENFSNGCMGTVDVTYPGAPFFLKFNPELLKAQLVPILDYARSPRWKFPFAPHDIGTYPLANGQVYGGGEITEDDQMPVEECGNMLLLVAAVCKAEGHGEFASKYWTVLSEWAEYLLDKGLDPEDQLCTDDFAGHMAHNANLSLKAILAIAAYAELCTMREEVGTAKSVREVAVKLSKQWLRMADDGDHTRLAFDQPGTWSQKYNLVWDNVLGLNLFPVSLAESEIEYYLRKQNKYGLPLDSRQDYTKLDWIVWCASMAERQEDFKALISPVWKFLNESASRVAMSDWYCTAEADHIFFVARSVVGGVYLPLITPKAS